MPPALEGRVLTTSPPAKSLFPVVVFFGLEFYIYVYEGYEVFIFFSNNCHSLSDFDSQGLLVS